MTLAFSGKSRSRQAILTFVALLSLGLAMLVGSNMFRSLGVNAADPPQPTYGSATVDGNSGEWNLTNDFFANMYRAGNPDFTVLSKLYVRYDCGTGILYVLVLAAPGVTIDGNADDDFVKLGQTKLVDGTDSPPNGTPPDLAYIMSGPDIIGWEASAFLAPGVYTDFNVHTNVDDGETSAVSGRAITLELICEAPTETPTDEPTTTPTEEPTLSPTEEATIVLPATPDPTEEPTEQPTAEATIVLPATPAPTEEPTDEPTEEATIVLPATPGPTDEPTDEPTATNTPDEDTAGVITSGATSTPGAPSTGSGPGSGTATGLTPLLLALGALALVFSGAAFTVARTRS